MAEAMDHAHQPRNGGHELYRDLRGEPGNHAAETALDADAILQLLREKGVLEVLKGAFGLAGKAMEVITETLEREEVVRTVSNATTLVKMLGSIEPDTLENMVKSLSRATEGSTSRKPPSLLHLLSQLSSGDARRALEPIAAALQALGRSIPRARQEDEHSPPSWRSEK